MHILHTALHTFSKVLTRRSCLSIKSFFSLGSSPSFLFVFLFDPGVFCKNKLDASHLRLGVIFLGKKRKKKERRKSDIFF